jgi:hypothetical protein
MYNISCEDHSEESFVVKGNDTIKFKDTLKEFGGKWNGSGWMFNSSLRNTINKFLELINQINSEKLISTPVIQNYTDKSFILIGETKPYKDKIKEMGGVWNSKLKDGNKAWVFSLTKQKDVEDWLNNEFKTQKKIKKVVIEEEEEEDEIEDEEILIKSFSDKKRLLK